MFCQCSLFWPIFTRLLPLGLYVKWPFDVFFNTPPKLKITGGFSDLLRNQNIQTDIEIVDIVSQLFDGLLDAVAYPHTMPSKFIAKAVGVQYLKS